MSEALTAPPADIGEIPATDPDFYVLGSADIPCPDCGGTGSAGHSRIHDCRICGGTGKKYRS